MKKKIIFILVIIAALYMASSTDKELMLHDCIEYRGGSDADCERCYFEIYGEHLTK